MRKIKLLIAFLISISGFVAFSSFAANENAKNPTATETGPLKQEYQKVIDEYKKHLQTVPKDLREEVKVFRKEMVRLNNEKREVYKKLSNQAQDFLKKEREFKKKLPIHMRKQLNTDNITEQSKDSEVKK
jgi:ABC-type phosphate transport system auxiliary subunit